jgi:Signal peptidase, peptidase S26
VPDPAAPEWTELRYHHVIPTPEQWSALRSRTALPSAPRAMLITDYSSYNTDLARDDRSLPRLAARPWLQPHWVGDLTLSCDLKLRRPVGDLRLELIKAGVSHRCEINLATGTAVLYRAGDSLGSPASTGINKPGTYELTFANVDDRLTLWVNGRLPFEEGGTFKTTLHDLEPTTADLEPARIAARAAEISVDRLVLKRDLFYTQDPAEPDYANLGDAEREASAFFETISDPSRFRMLTPRPPREYPVRPGHYLMLGDNSPWSRDARVWGRSDQIDPELPGRGWDNSPRSSWEVPAKLLIGKAFCVYWPHPKPVWPAIRVAQDLRLPVFPYIERMRWIR